MRIFTKNFFQLPENDQAAVVEAVISDLESCLGRHRDRKTDRKAEKKIALIRRRAIEHGVGVDRANPHKHGDLPGQLLLWPE